MPPCLLPRARRNSAQWRPIGNGKRLVSEARGLARVNRRSEGRERHLDRDAPRATSPVRRPPAAERPRGEVRRGAIRFQCSSLAAVAPDMPYAKAITRINIAFVWRVR